MINVLFIFSMFCCLLRASLSLSLPAFWFTFCEPQCTRNWRENQIKDFLRALSILFVFHTARSLSAAASAIKLVGRRRQGPRFFLDIIKFAQNRVWWCSSMLCTISYLCTTQTQCLLARSLAFVSIAAHIDPNLPRKAKEEAAAAKMDDFMLKS